MDIEGYEKYIKAGRIAAEARDFGLKLIRENVNLLEVATTIESKIIMKGANLPFPVNISINNIAAHYTPRKDDTRVFQRGDVVKLDVGSHVDGYIADTAGTIEVGTSFYDMMIAASHEALSAAIETLRAGISLSDIGKVIEQEILSHGFKPIDNLTGHSLKRYQLHSGLSVPNISGTSPKIKTKAGDVLAIEPFATNGAGHVISGDGSNIYRCDPVFRSKIIRDSRAKIIFSKLQKKYKTLPFAQRWIHMQPYGEDSTLRRLSFLGLIKQYPQLIEANSGIITQEEHTIIVTKNGCQVIT